MLPNLSRSDEVPVRITVWGEPIEITTLPWLRALQESYHAETMARYQRGVHLTVRTIHSALDAGCHVD